MDSNLRSAGSLPSHVRASIRLKVFSLSTLAGACSIMLAVAHFHEMRIRAFVVPLLVTPVAIGDDEWLAILEWEPTPNVAGLNGTWGGYVRLL